MSMRYKRGVPSKINRDFSARRIDAAFISSVTAKKYRHAPLGIVAKEEVLSVLLIPGQSVRCDSASATSNRLAEILGLRGEVIIGDNALRLYLKGSDAIDLAKAWHEKYRLPFVFALLCYHRHGQRLEQLSQQFLKAPVKIPRYELLNASRRTGIAPDDILHYLTYISYRLDTKAMRGLKKFQQLH